MSPYPETGEITKSTAARKDVRKGKPVTEITPVPLTQQGFATPDSLGNEAGRPQSATLQSEIGAQEVPRRADTLYPAGTQAPPVDTEPARQAINPRCINHQRGDPCIFSHKTISCWPCDKAWLAAHPPKAAAA